MDNYDLNILELKFFKNFKIIMLFWNIYNLIKLKIFNDI